MGGCMSSPKDLALNEGEAPVETPVTPKAVDAAEGETKEEAPLPQEKEEGGEDEVEKKEEPLLDISTPAEEAKPAAAETKAEEAKTEEAPAEKDKSDAPLVTL